MKIGQLLKQVIIPLAVALLLSNNSSAQSTSSCTCNCLRPLFDYMIASHNMFIRQEYNTTLSTVVARATTAEYRINYFSCGLFYKNMNNAFYAVTTDSVTTEYKARLGDCTVALKTADGTGFNVYNLVSMPCGNDEKVFYATKQNPTKAVAVLQIDSCYTCQDQVSAVCNSAITESPVNPYLYGIAGNWRPAKSYAYYASRAETDPAQQTDIKKNGTFSGFAPFWAIQPGKQMAPRYDTTRWVWNSASTKFNKRGYEIENKDPLGRYNAGLYGYDNALAVAVVQNSRYREAAFEGFEDYGFNVGACDISCSSSRNFDFSLYKAKLDSTHAHTGRYSLRLEKDSSAVVSAMVVTTDDDAFALTVNKTTGVCTGPAQLLQSINASSNTVLPAFSPLAGKTVLVSAWVKEEQDCSVPAYTGSQIGIVVQRGGAQDDIALIARPAGNIIEGWQRFEQVLALPADATMFSIALQATGGSTVYFDDIRVHPYNANMKSFVYDAVNLRLVAGLDENNYATFYEYDDDGTLVRLKKETERGIKTIKETRSALVKDGTE